jgi:hypothetical protein
MTSSDQNTGPGVVEYFIRNGAREILNCPDAQVLEKGNVRLSGKRLSNSASISPGIPIIRDVGEGFNKIEMIYERQVF